MGGVVANAVDSWGAPNPAALARLGILVSCRYLSDWPVKNLSAAEVGRLRSAGVAPLPNWENAAGDAAYGATAGTYAGRRVKTLMAALKAPDAVGVAYSVDYNVQPAGYKAAADYLEAARNAQGKRPLGVYGHANLIDWLAANRPGLCDFYWQTYAWSAGRLSKNADLYQFLNGQDIGVGTKVDLNLLIRPARVPAWWPSNATPSGGGQPVAFTKDDLRVMLGTDGVIKAPAAAPDIKTNPFWAWGSHITTTTNNTVQLRAAVAQLATAIGALASAQHAADAQAARDRAALATAINAIGQRIEQLAATGGLSIPATDIAATLHIAGTQS